MKQKNKIKKSILWSFDIVALNNHKTVVYHCPDCYVMRKVCEEVAKTTIALVYPKCDYVLTKIIHTEVL